MQTRAIFASQPHPKSLAAASSGAPNPSSLPAGCPSNPSSPDAPQISHRRMHLLQPLARSLHHIHWVSTKNGRLQMLSSTFSLPPEDGRRQRARRCRHLTATASLSRCRAFQIQVLFSYSLLYDFFSFLDNFHTCVPPVGFSRNYKHFGIPHVLGTGGSNGSTHICFE